MEIQEPNENVRGASSSNDLPNPEVNSKVQPRIYVASLSDYNEGRLHGVWIDAATDPDDLFASIQQMLDHSPSVHAEEFAIHDYEGFGPWQPGEYESIATVSAVAQGLDEYGPAFAHWANIIGTTEPLQMAGFEEAFIGQWPSIEDYAESLFEGMGVELENQLPEPLSYYVHIDYGAFARDLELSGDIATSEGEGGVYVFEGHR